LVIPLNGFESDGCRYVQDGRATGFVTRCVKIFPRRAFEASVGWNRRRLMRYSVFFSSNLSASVHRTKIGTSSKIQPRTIRLEKVLMKTG